jgi:hypothetical protein
MKRTIVQLAGNFAEWALASDGSIWLWTSQGWTNAGRGPLPDAPGGDFMESFQLPPAGPPTIVAPLDHPAQRYQPPTNPPPVKRGPGRPRKNP